MYIGLLKVKDVRFAHKDTDVPFLPDVCENGCCTWHWDTVYDSVLDARYTLETECFVGAVALKISDASVKKIEVFINQTLCGAYCAESGRDVGGTINIPTGGTGSVVTVRFYTDLRDLSVESVELLGAREDGTASVYPTPKQIEYIGGFVGIKDIVSKNGDEDEMFAAAFLKERLSETFGTWQRARGAVIVFDKTSDESYDGERYTIRTDNKTVTVSAQTRLPLLYGADTLLQLFERGRGIPRVHCDDRPTKALRGFHAGLPCRDQFDFMKRLFRYVLLPLRYNTLFVELAGGMRYKSHPEISQTWERAADEYRRGLIPKPPHMTMVANGEILEHEEVQRYVGFAKELGFDIVPEVQSLGHVQYITMAHPEIAEIDTEETAVKDTRNEDVRPASVYHHCYCPSLEESYQIIFDLMDEIIDVVKPQRYVHIGHDEVYQIGVCPRCRGKEPAKLFATHVNRLHDHLAARGLGTMMWSDMLQPPPARPYATYPAIDLLPKDIVMLDFVWYFNMDHDIENNLLAKGYPVAVGNLYSSHFPRYRDRIMKDHMIGGQVSMWLENNEGSYGDNGKLWDCIYLSEMLWNPETYDERNRRTYTERIIKDIQPVMRDEVRGKYEARGYSKVSVTLPRAAKAPKELLKLCPKAILMQGESISVGAAFERLVFEHATVNAAPRIMWKPIDKIGDYRVAYADGTVLSVPVKYGSNIMAYDTTYGAFMPQEYYRHNGYVGTWFSDPVYRQKRADGSDMTVYGFLWENPYPEKEIAAITYQPIENDYCGLILVGIKGLNKK